MSSLYTVDYSSPRFRNIRRALRAVALAILPFAVLPLHGCHRPAAPAAPLAMVVASPVQSLSASGADESIRYPVEVAARYSNAMSFRVAGKLIERNVRLGDSVRKGQVIARLDPVDAEKQALSAQAALDAADHRLVYAKQQMERDQAQSAQNLIAVNQLEQTQDAYAAALAVREQSAAQQVVARNALQYATLVADHDGLITSENADTGQVVSAGQAIYGLAWSGDIDVNLDAAASDLSRIAVGQTAQVTFPALPGHAFEARVRELAPAADPQSRTYRVKLTLTQPGTAVRLGMTGDATLAASTSGNTAGPPAFKVPTTAIFHRGSEPAVWVIRPADSTLELRPVTVGSYAESAVLITGGLKGSEDIVLAGVHTVYAGQQVKPIKPLFDDESGIARTGGDIRPGGGTRTGAGAGAVEGAP
jgi:membrane fusion protein, multidrug efflux system